MRKLISSVKGNGGMVMLPLGLCRGKPLIYRRHKSVS